MLLELFSWRRGNGKFNGISHAIRMVVVDVVVVAIRMVVVVVAIFLGERGWGRGKRNK